MRLELLAIALVAAATLAGCAPLSTRGAPSGPVVAPPASPPEPVVADTSPPKKPAVTKRPAGTQPVRKQPTGTPAAGTQPADEQNLPPDPEPESKALPPDVPQLYADGLAAHQSGQYDAALRDWERVWEQAPEYADVGDRLLREYLVRGLESFAEGRLDAAIQQWEMAQRVRPADTRVQAYLERAREQQVREAPPN